MEEYIGDYKLIKHLSTGQMGNVYIGQQSENDPKVLLKITTNKPLFNREVKILKKIQNIQGVFKYIESFSENDKFIIVGEYINGIDLYDYILTNSFNVNESLCKIIFKKLVTIVDNIHSIGVIHRDIKPENVILYLKDCEIVSQSTEQQEENEEQEYTESNVNVYLIDWGLAFEEDEETERDYCGSANYCCPELVSHKWYKGPEVDAWSLGATLYTLLTRTLAFNGPPDSILYKQICNAKVNWTRKGLTPLSIKLLKDIFEKRISIKEIKESSWLNT